MGEAQQLAQPADFDLLPRVGEHYVTLRRYAFAFLAALPLRATPAARSLLAAIDILRSMNATGARKLPADAPIAFISQRWQKLVPTEQGLLRKLGSYPRQNGLAVALREVCRIERSLFILDWLQSVDLRRRVQVRLNKGEARHALDRAVFFHRLGKIRDRGFEQRYRARGLNLLTAAIVWWNTVYLQRAVQALHTHGQPVDEALLPYLSPLGWEHINLMGDYS